MNERLWQKLNDVLEEDGFDLVEEAESPHPHYVWKKGHIELMAIDECLVEEEPGDEEEEEDWS